MIGCDRLVEFIDGELLPMEADQFRDHLGACWLCQRRVPEEMRLSARLSTLTPSQQDELVTKIKHGIIAFEDE